ncbi:MAG: helix-turn-helix domain-containing protein [Firmicutes bacterium]|nr:helix-turn-helix domain-containing protein [Bacillota bacterium]
MDQTIYEVKDIMRIMRVSRNTAYKLIKQEGIPHIYLGGHYKIPADRFHEWLSIQFAHLHDSFSCDTIDT